MLDIGSGLGGPARCLAYVFGCRVDGVELSPLRCAQATRLTARVALDRLVTFTCGDILSVDLPRQAFDVIWGQGAWMHIADTSALFQRVAAALAPGGRVAFEDACLARAARGDSEARVLEELEQLWGGRFLSQDAWRAGLAGASLEVEAIDDLSGAFLADFRRLDDIARGQGAGQYPANETKAFAHAITLASAGVIGYASVVARGATRSASPRRA